LSDVKDVGSKAISAIQESRPKVDEALGNLKDAVNKSADRLMSRAVSNLKKGDISSVAVGTAQGTVATFTKLAASVLPSNVEGIDFREAASGIVGKISNLGSKGSQILKNKIQGDAFEKAVKQKLQKTLDDVVEQITVKTKSGTKTRLDLVGKEKSTNLIKLTEAKSSSKAPLTENQKIAFPEIEKSGATVVGKGKEPYPGGTEIPPTKVDIVRPE